MASMDDQYGNHTYDWWLDVNGSIAEVRCVLHRDALGIPIEERAG